MANYNTLISAIQSVIAENGNNEITGNILQQTLVAMIGALGGGYQFGGIATPQTTPGTPDEKIFYLGSSGTYPNFGPAVIPSGNMGVFYYDSSWHVGMIEFPIGEGTITKANLSSALLNELLAGFVYAGKATPTGNPGALVRDSFFLTTTSGNYSNFGGLTVQTGEIAVLRYTVSTNTWNKESIEIPEMVQIVDNLVEGGSDKALSGEMGKILGERTSKVLVVDFNGVPYGGKWIGAGGIPTTQGYHYSVNLNGVKTIKIQANANGVAVFCWASAITSEGWTLVGNDRIIIQDNEIHTYIVPNGANFLIVGERSSDAQAINYYTPSLLELYYAGSLKELDYELRMQIETSASKERIAGGIRFCTYNIGRFSQGQQAASIVTQNTYERYLSRYKRIINAANPDILVMEEYNDVFCPNYDGSPKYAKDVLFDQFPVRQLNPNISTTSKYNIAIYSYRWLSNFVKAYLPSDNVRYYMMADYLLNGITVKVVVVHFNFTIGDNDALTLQMLNEMITILSGYEYVILAGDMNMISDKTHFQVLENAGYAIANCGDFGDFETYNGSAAGVTNNCIDQIAVKGFKISNVKMINEVPFYYIGGASDHYPLVCDLIMTNI